MLLWVVMMKKSAEDANVTILSPNLIPDEEAVIIREEAPTSAQRHRVVAGFLLLCFATIIGTNHEVFYNVQAKISETNQRSVAYNSKKTGVAYDSEKSETNQRGVAYDLKKSWETPLNNEDICPNVSIDENRDMSIENPYIRQRKDGSGGELMKSDILVRTYHSKEQHREYAFKGFGNLSAEKLQELATLHCRDYATAYPYKHIVLDDMVPADILRASMREFQVCMIFKQCLFDVFCHF